MKNNNQLLYEAFSKINSKWIEDNSVSHAFSDGKGVIELNNTVKSIGYCAFACCKELTSIIIPDSVMELEIGVFEDCSSLISVTIPDSVTSIREYAFSGCKGLTSINIPDSVKEIGHFAFDGCSNLTSFIISGTDIMFDKDAFNGCENLSKETIEKLFLCRLGFATMNELKSNFVDRGDYIVFKKPIKGIVMVQKNYSEVLDWESANDYSQKLRLGGFSDWKIPLVEELQLLYEIKDLCDLKQHDCYFWSSSQNIRRDFCENGEGNELEYFSCYRLIANLNNGNVCYRTNYCRVFDGLEVKEVEDGKDLGKWNLRCVRIFKEGKRCWDDTSSW